MSKIEKIDHVIVLMLENRLFDHILGYLLLEKNRKGINGLTGNEDREHCSNEYSKRTSNISCKKIQHIRRYKPSNDQSFIITAISENFKR